MELFASCERPYACARVEMNDAATLAGYGFEDGYTLIGYHDPNVSRRKETARMA